MEALKHLITELLDDGLWPREVLDLLRAFLDAEINEKDFSELEKYIRVEYCGGELNGPDVPAYSMRQPKEPEELPTD
jgi:hypothetical protein